MTNKDIFNYVSFKEELEHIINHYIEQGLPATVLLPIVVDAVSSMDSFSKTEIKTAIQEVEKENKAEHNSDDESVGLTD